MSTQPSPLLAARAAFCAMALFLVLVGAAGAQGTPGPIEMGERGAEFYFEPKQLTVPAGQVTLAFKNVGERRHNWVAQLPEGPQRTPDVDGGRDHTQTFTFAQPGTYEVICDLPTHLQRGMRMTLTVSPAAPPASGAATGATSGAAQAQATVGGAGSGQAGTGSSSGATSTGAQGATTTSQSGSTTASVSAAGTPYLISLMIHIPAAIAWLGIVLYDAIVVAVPFLTPAQRGSLLYGPRWLMLATIPLFALTGIYQTIFNPFGTITSYEDLSHLRAETAYGFALFLKHGFVFASMALTLALTYYFAPRLVAFADDIRPEATSPSRMPGLLAWANVLACVALLACVAVMVFQLH